MKRLLIFLPLLCIIGSQYPCDVLKLPDSKKDCFKRKSSIDNHECCYLNLKVKDSATGIEAPVNVCCPGQKSLENKDYVNLIETYGNAFIAGREFSVEDHECKSSYIKVGLLMLSLFLI